MSRFLIFEKLAYVPGYRVLNKKKEVLGFISFHKPWKKWVFEPAYNDIIMDAVCLKDLAEFMEKLK